LAAVEGFENACLAHENRSAAQAAADTIAQISLLIDVEAFMPLAEIYHD
jgi:hypothetical protein